MTKPEATPQQAHAALADGAVLIDVREPWEYRQKRIPGAILIPLGEIAERLDELPEDTAIFVHCRLGGRSARAVDYLRSVGRGQALNVIGGIEAWEEAGLPVETGAIAPSP